FLDDARNGAEPLAALLSDGPQSVEIMPFESDIGLTDFIKILFPGTSGKSGDGDAPTTGIIGSNGGLRLPGESACSNSWRKALRTKETSISIPCYAERRYGGVADDELLIAMPPDEFARDIEGLEALSKNGQRYSIPRYGAHADPSEGMGKSYG
ncbi:MAG: DUF1177 family protein, partial [Pseudomonadota bacterium]|nr:DUF1177 family protein [Pseudomonadota bacterium]